jgi:hypothetical protein
MVMNRPILVIATVLLYILLLTGIFENFINRASSTFLTALAIILFIIAIAEAERKIAEARGDSASAVIQAAGEAEAIRRKQLSLTPTYIEFIKAQKWDGKFPTTLAGSGANFLMQLPKE